MITGTPGLEDDFQLLGTRLAGRIVIESVVARGGFGLVYRGHHEALGVPVAVKLLLDLTEYSARMREEFSERFVREARLIAKLSHPATVRLIDHGVDLMPRGELSPWMALEWLDGSSLSHAMRARAGRAYTVTEALGVIRPVLEALAEAHSQGIAHRDVTPGNVFVCEHGAATRLIDFGIAREMEDDAAPGMGVTATRSTFHAFTARYAAPEQVSHARTGPWTDVHGVGLMLTQMLTGEAPYPGLDETERVAQVLSGRRPTPAEFGVDVGSLESVIARCVSLRPTERYPNARAILDALDALDALEVSGTQRVVAEVSEAVTQPAAPSGPLASRDSRIVLGIVTTALCALGVIAAFASSGSPKPSAPLVASVPRSQAVIVTHDRPVVITQGQGLSPREALPAPALPESSVGTETVGGNDTHRPRRVVGRRAARPRSPEPPVAAGTRAVPELPRCTSYHQRNCRP